MTGMLEIRDAGPGDVRPIAELFAIAGAGIPEWLWSEMADASESPLDVGMRRAARDVGNFSWRNALFATVAGRVVGMILGYRLAADDYDIGGVPAVLRPFLELKRLVPNSWYINAFAIFPSWQGKGIGAHLLRAARTRALRDDCRLISVQTFSATPRAGAFYRRHGFWQVDARRLPETSPCLYGGSTILLTSEVMPPAESAPKLAATRATTLAT